jgi:hypothetical protein
MSPIVLLNCVKLIDLMNEQSHSSGFGQIGLPNALNNLIEVESDFRPRPVLVVKTESQASQRLAHVQVGL